jgi:hypothetical protein
MLGTMSRITVLALLSGFRNGDEGSPSGQWTKSGVAFEENFTL